MDEANKESDLNERKRVRAAYLLVSAEPFLAPLLQDVGDSPVRDAHDEFVEHLRSTILATTVPYLLTRHAVISSRYQAILASERIRAIDVHEVANYNPSGALTQEAAEGARIKAQHRLHEELSTSEGSEELTREIRWALVSHLDDNDVELASKELLHQGTVGVWTALEVYLKNIAKAVVNHDPSKGVALLNSDKTKSIFGAKGMLSSEILEEHGFDLRRAMGDAVFSSQKLDALPAIRSVFDVVFPNNKEISASLKDRQLWLLNQRRHLLVHRRGIIDRHYLANTGDSLPLGARLSITGQELSGYLNTARDLALLIADAANQALAE